MGAYSKSGDSAITGLIKPGEFPAGLGLHLLDVAPDGEVRYGIPNINDNAKITELIIPPDSAQRHPFQRQRG